MKKIEVRLTKRQAKAIRAISRAARVSEKRTVVAAVVSTLGLEWEDPKTLLEQVQIAAKRGDDYLRPPDRLPCGLRI